MNRQTDLLLWWGAAAILAAGVLIPAWLTGGARVERYWWVSASALAIAAGLVLVALLRPPRR